MTPDEIHRAAELARASWEAERLFYVLMFGGLLIFAFWTMVRWWLDVTNRCEDRFQRLLNYWKKWDEIERGFEIIERLLRRQEQENEARLARF